MARERKQKEGKHSGKKKKKKTRAISSFVSKESRSQRLVTSFWVAPTLGIPILGLFLAPYVPVWFNSALREGFEDFERVPDITLEKLAEVIESLLMAIETFKKMKGPLRRIMGNADK